jgi:hypothetical protein
VAHRQRVEGRFSKRQRNLDKVAEGGLGKRFGVLPGEAKPMCSILPDIRIVPAGRIKIDAALKILRPVSRNIRHLQAAAEINGVPPTHLSAIVPRQDIAHQQTDRRSHAVGVAIKVSAAVDLPIHLCPVRHAIGHSCRIRPNTWSDLSGRMRSPATEIEADRCDHIPIRQKEAVKLVLYIGPLLERVPLKCHADSSE